MVVKSVRYEGGGLFVSWLIDKSKNFTLNTQRKKNIFISSSSKNKNNFWPPKRTKDGHVTYSKLPQDLTFFCSKTLACVLIGGGDTHREGFRNFSKRQAKFSFCPWERCRSAGHAFFVNSTFDYFIPVSIKFDWSFKKMTIRVFSKIFSENFTGA